MTDQQVSNLIDEFHVPLHVRRHCVAVAEFALQLGNELAKAGIKIDLKLLGNASLLHDIARIVDFRELHPEKFPDPVTAEDIKCWQELRTKYLGMHHADAAALILEERGFTDIAAVIKAHKYMQITKGFKSWEEKLLYYADKRVKHDKTVPLMERLYDGRMRNAPDKIGDKTSDEIDKKVLALEQEIFEKTGIM